ncbi:MAG: threonine synthase [Armatimonadota bacterium]|nr:threonine synthase [Armatimonadota bacterium]MDR7468943.1 threonine synthase [Armatimonadota bacterium]MDR7539504.1 threonine synthase [Armatimonadota bacterium]
MLHRRVDTHAWPGVIERYRPFLPVTSQTPVITLLEGNTPLVESARLGPRLGVHLLFKLESTNPSGSFKDRGMTVAVSKALEAGSRAVICASTGNTAASAAAYAARAGLPCLIVLPAAGVAAGKLAQAFAHGARLVTVEGGFDVALAVTREVSARLELALVNSVNPHRIAGQKTAAFEICDVLGSAPDLLVLPVGNAGNITAYWRGFLEYQAAGRIAAPPRMVGVQAAGAAPLVDGRPVECPQTVASAIRIGNPASWQGAVAAASESRGRFIKVTDEAILAAQERLAVEEGVLVEPASAAAVAGLLELAEAEPPRGGIVVCVLTGHGLKDPQALPRAAALPPPVPPTEEAVGRAVLSLLG